MLKNSSTLAVSVAINLYNKLEFVFVNGPGKLLDVAQRCTGLKCTWITLSHQF